MQDKTKMSNKKDKLYWQKAQTLNEAIIAVMLLTFGVIGMLGAVVSSLGRMEIVGDRATATFLAAEGVEVAKSIVDGRSLVNGRNRTDPTGANWNQDFEFINEYFQLDYRHTATAGREILVGGFNPANGLSPSETVAMNYLNYDTTSLIFSYASGGDNIASKFKRVVGVESVSSGTAIRLVSYVTWADRRGNWQTAKTETYLFNWR